MAKPTPTSATLAQQRSAQAARAFLNRPQAGQQGAPQNRAERRHAARVAGRKPKEASFDTKERRAQEQPIPARELVAAAPAALGRSAAGAALSLHRGLSSGALFPWREMIPALMLFCFVCIVGGLWFAMGTSRTGFLAVHAPAITTAVVVAFGVALVGLSWRSVLPAVGALSVSMWSAMSGVGPHFFNWLLAAFGLTFVWLLGPQVGDIFDSKKRARQEKLPD